MSAMRSLAAVPDDASVKARGDQAWLDAGRDTVNRLAKLVRKRAKAVRRRVDVDEVHDMRTATRRLRTAIKLYGAEARKQRREAVEDELKRAARRLGVVRDLDILLEALDAPIAIEGGTVDAGDLGPLRQAWQDERKDGVRRLKAELARRRFGRSLRESRRLVSTVDGGSPSARDHVATRAPSLIWDAFGKVLAFEVDPATADPARIHEMRIAAKKLRYTLEAFEDALEPGATLIEDVTALQDAAGSMHDAIVASERARATIDPKDLKRRERAAIDAFAESQARRAEQLRPAIGQRLRTVRSRGFRGSLARAVAGMGHVST